MHNAGFFYFGSNMLPPAKKRESNSWKIIPTYDGNCSTVDKSNIGIIFAKLHSVFITLFIDRMLLGKGKLEP